MLATVEKCSSEFADAPENWLRAFVERSYIRRAAGRRWSIGEHMCCFQMWFEPSRQHSVTVAFAWRSAQHRRGVFRGADSMANTLEQETLVGLIKALRRLAPQGVQDIVARGESTVKVLKGFVAYCSDAQALKLRRLSMAGRELREALALIAHGSIAGASSSPRGESSGDQCRSPHENEVAISFAKNAHALPARSGTS
ncbi:hypothetical protein Esti_004936 [Eimeria stiedai]